MSHSCDFLSAGLSQIDYSGISAGVSAIHACTRFIGALALTAIALSAVPLPSKYNVSQDRTWNENLEGALGTSDVIAYNYAIEMGADVNRPGNNGNTPLQTAIAAKNLPACKILLDRGAVPTEQDQSKIEQALRKKGVLTNQTHLFFQQRPTLHTPQVLMPDGTFVNVASMAPSSRITEFTKPIALFLIENEGINEYFGAVTKEFDEHAIFTFYQRIASNFTVIRVHMNDRNQILPMMDQIHDFFPGLPFLNFTIHGHGNPNCVELGPNSFLTAKDTTILEQAGLRLHPKATVTVSGCECANGPNNLIERMSFYMKRVVMGSPKPVGGTIAEIKYSQPDLPTLVSFHSTDMEDDFHVYACKNGIKVASGEQQDKSVVKNILAAINNTRWSIKGLSIREIFTRQRASLSAEQIYALRVKEIAAITYDFQDAPFCVD